MKETLEEASENYSKITLNKNGLMSDKQINGFIAGAKWQAEKMYSEEDVFEIIKKYNLASYSPLESEKIKKWLEQFKKK